jgi:probable phosphoglycerate mutase
MENRALSIVLVRHGQTRATSEGRLTGRDGIELDDKGRRQATCLARRLEDSEFALVLTSPVVRARQTCEQAGFGEQAELVDELVEWDYGRFEGQVANDVRRARPGWSLFEHGAPDGESPRQVVERVDRLVTRLRDTDGRVLVVSHGHLLRSLIVRWMGLELTSAGRLSVDPASLSQLGVQSGQATLLGLNDTAHLARVRSAARG